MGDDQILDVELNRGTPFREAQIVDVNVVKWLDFAAAADESPHVQPSDWVERSRESKKLSKKGQLTEAVLDAEDARRIEEMQWLDVILRRLAGKIPMTSQGESAEIMVFSDYTSVQRSSSHRLEV